jgi:uncharacterized membrane protein YidH (DUF202 family)
MMAGLVLAIMLGIFLLIGVPILTSIFMKILWRNLGKAENLKNKKPYYKDPLLFIPCIVFSVSLLVIIFYILILLFDKLNPGFGYN